MFLPRLGFAIVLWLGLTAVSAAPAGATQLAVAWPQNVGPLNPHLYTPNQMFAQSMVYEPLVKYQADGSVSPWLAESWRQAPDGQSYLFFLRRDVVFSNGEPFDAAAVVANIQAVLANRSRHAWLELANKIDRAEAVDSHTVRLVLNAPYYPTLQELALPRPFRFIAPSQFTHGGTRAGIIRPIGTGPWVLGESRPGESDKFVRNDRYWGTRPAFDQVLVKVIPDPISRAIALESGEVELVYGIEGPLVPDTFERFKQQGRFTTALSAPMETQMIALNSHYGPTRDLAVRQAINHAVNKDRMIDRVLYHTQKRADTLFAPNVPYADVGLEPYDYNPATAAALLDGDGWRLRDGEGVRYKDGRPLSIELAFVGTDATSKAMSEVIQGDLRKVGMRIELIGEEESSIYARQRDGRFGMIFNRTWGAPYDPHAFLSSMRAPSHADYQAQLGLPDKPLIDAQITQVLSTADQAQRRALYRSILTRLHRQAVYLPLSYVSSMAVAEPSLGAIVFPVLSSDIPFDQFTPPAAVTP